MINQIENKWLRRLAIVLACLTYLPFFVLFYMARSATEAAFSVLLGCYETLRYAWEEA